MFRQQVGIELARWQPIDDIGHRGMSITIPQDNGEFAFDMPVAWVKNNTLPPLLFDIFTQLNDIDNIMQQSCRRLAERHRRHSREYELYLFDPPDALYVTQGGVAYLDYTATRVKQKFPRISEAERRQVAAVLRRGLYQTVSGRLSYLKAWTSFKLKLSGSLTPAKGKTCNKKSVSKSKA